eukprot:2984179-Amphidinium_carterae.2
MWKFERGYPGIAGPSAMQSLQLQSVFDHNGISASLHWLPQSRRTSRPHQEVECMLGSGTLDKPCEVRFIPDLCDPLE